MRPLIYVYIYRLKSGHYSSARTFFTAFGREFPRREVHNNIGLTHVAEAMEARERLLSMGENLGPGFMFRYVLDEDAGIPKERTQLQQEIFMPVMMSQRLTGLTSLSVER